jgi:hypothetical protein
MNLFGLVTLVLTGGLPGLTEDAVAKVEPPTLAIESSIVLNVADGRPAADKIVAKVEELGGYFSERSDLALLLKVPVAQTDTLLEFVADLGTILQRSQQAVDLRVTLEQHRTRVASKRKMLEQYMEVLKTANARAIVSVERQVTALVEEIESLRGAIALLEHRLRLSVVRVSFRLQKRETPVAAGNSPFPWLNTVNLVDLYGDFLDEPQ